jgi:hypothetical protein
MAKARKKKVEQVGQGNLLSGTIEGLDKLVNKPEVLEHDGLKVIKLIVPKNESDTPGYTETALALARKLVPDIKSQERPPWLRQGWQVKRRKKQAGVL